ncbi:MAG TPA: RelA/SpoT domain-containing protein [Acidobacteriota bacterium]|nr:RelA/SpoT domain-containing protein [Acidobacteriota bacterium]
MPQLQDLDPRRFKRWKEEYEGLKDGAVSFCQELQRQVTALLEAERIHCAFPIQSRLKSWDSITEKIRRGPVNISKLTELQDLVGMRVILLFLRDVDRTRDLFKHHFSVRRSRDTGDRLGDDQFGYSSYHMVVELDEKWRAVPTLARVGGMSAEVQIRTLAQHMWAEFSAHLQYKREAGTPREMRRAVARGSALLEVLDIEFDRLLDSHQSTIPSIQSTDELNVDVIRTVLEADLPTDHEDDREMYDVLHRELTSVGIDRVEQLRDLIARHLPSVREHEAYLIATFRPMQEQVAMTRSSRDRHGKGVFFNHTGLIRTMLSREFPDDYRQMPDAGP